MTFTAIVSKIMDELNLTSTQAQTRIGDNVNLYYKMIASSLGMQMIERGTSTIACTPSNPLITFPVQKIERVWNPNFTPFQMLGELTVEEIRMDIPGTDPAQNFARYTQDYNSTTLLLDSTPSTNYTLTAEGLINMSTLAGSNIPKIPEDYHDILLYGPRAVEYRKMEKFDEAKEQMGYYETRLGQLRFYTLTSGWLQLYQAKDAPSSISTTAVPLT